MSIEMQAKNIYAYFLYEIAPEFIPNSAFSQISRIRATIKKNIKCPYCREVVTVVDETVKIKIYRHSRKTNITYHKSISCKSCRQEVGIVYTMV